VCGTGEVRRARGTASTTVAYLSSVRTPGSTRPINDLVRQCSMLHVVTVMFETALRVRTHSLAHADRCQMKLRRKTTAVTLSRA